MVEFGLNYYNILKSSLSLALLRVYYNLIFAGAYIYHVHIYIYIHLFIHFELVMNPPMNKNQKSGFPETNDQLSKRRWSPEPL